MPATSAVLRAPDPQEPALGPVSSATRKAVRPFPVKGHRIYLYNNNTLMVCRTLPGA